MESARSNWLVRATCLSAVTAALSLAGCGSSAPAGGGDGGGKAGSGPAMGAGGMTGTPGAGGTTSGSGGAAGTTGAGGTTNSADGHTGNSGAGGATGAGGGTVTGAGGSADSCVGAAYDPASPPQTLTLTGNLGAHDPAAFVQGNTIYLAATGLTSKTSSNLTAWTNGGNPLARPAWVTTMVPGATSLWAPDISFFGGQYHLYYAASTFGSNR